MAGRSTPRRRLACRLRIPFLPLAPLPSTFRLDGGTLRFRSWSMRPRSLSRPTIAGFALAWMGDPDSDSAYTFGLVALGADGAATAFGGVTLGVAEAVQTLRALEAWRRDGARAATPKSASAEWQIPPWSAGRILAVLAASAVRGALIVLGAAGALALVDAQSAAGEDIAALGRWVKPVAAAACAGMLGAFIWQCVRRLRGAARERHLTVRRDTARPGLELREEGPWMALGDDLAGRLLVVRKGSGAGARWQVCRLNEAQLPARLVDDLPSGLEALRIVRWIRSAPGGAPGTDAPA